MMTDREYHEAIGRGTADMEVKRMIRDRQRELRRDYGASADENERVMIDAQVLELEALIGIIALRGASSMQEVRKT